MGDRSSYAWRSVMFGRELLTKGMRKIIGSGEDTLVWRDRWIDDKEPRTPHGFGPALDMDLKVNTLIDPNSGEWCRICLDNLFTAEDINHIQRDKPNLRKKDRYVWSFNHNGCYSVKSEYWLSGHFQNRELLAIAKAKPSLNPLKVKCWKLATAPKIKNFMWKVLNGALAVPERLQTRGLIVDKQCQVCGATNESINHILFSCPVARQVWAFSNVPTPINGFSDDNLFMNIQHIFEVCDDTRYHEEIRSSPPWLMWQLWKNQNLLLFERKFFPTNMVVQKAFYDALSWSEVNKKQDHAIIHGNGEEEKWQPLCVGFVKCNVGMCWSKKDNIAGASWVFRDYQGRTLMHSRRSFSGILTKCEAAIQSWSWAMESMQSLHFHKVIFAAYTRELVKALNKPQDWPVFEMKIDKLVEEMTNHQDWIVLYEETQANKGAFAIAQSVIRDGRTQSYVAQGYPRWLQGIFLQEQGNG